MDQKAAIAYTYQDSTGPVAGKGDTDEEDDSEEDIDMLLQGNHRFNSLSSSRFITIQLFNTQLTQSCSAVQLLLQDAYNDRSFNYIARLLCT